MIIAGEASGDLHASFLAEAIKSLDPEAAFAFLGGDRTARATGERPVVHISQMAFMGFSEVLRNLKTIGRNMAAARQTVDTFRPDALILVDYPSFNLKVARHAKKAGITNFYYISPKVWAWKEHRVKAIKRLIDKMLVIFPFEVDFYREKHDYAVEYVGNPTLSEVDGHLAALEPRSDFLARHGLRDRPLIALLPGSRKGEIRNNLRVMAEVVERFPQYRGVIAGAPGIPLDFYRDFSELPVVYDDTLALVAHSKAALVTSGTATLETALVATPQVACYRSNGQPIAYKIMKHILKVPFVTLPNLIAGREVIPEMLVHMCTPDAVTEKLIPLLKDSPERERMANGYAEVRRRLETDGSAPLNAARVIVQYLDRKRVL